MSRLRRVIGAALLLAVVVSSGAVPSPKPSPFPHTKHSRLFTSCAPCHAEIGTDRPEELVRVSINDCARCHDGQTAPPVAWQPPLPDRGNFKFSHEQHVGREKIACTVCHLAAGATGRMPDMVRPTAETCLACHQATSHLAADASCSTCHGPCLLYTSDAADE